MIQDVNRQSSHALQLRDMLIINIKVKLHYSVVTKLCLNTFVEIDPETLKKKHYNAFSVTINKKYENEIQR